MKGEIRIVECPKVHCSGVGQSREDTKNHISLGKSVQEKLGVNKKFGLCSDVGDFARDRITSFDVLLPDLIDSGIRVLFYAGDQDYICSWIGYERAVEQMEWPGQNDFLKAPHHEYEDTHGTSIGLLRSIKWREQGMVGFFQIYRAGHHVPSDQPEAALLMINDFISGVMGSENDL